MRPHGKGPWFFGAGCGHKRGEAPWEKRAAFGPFGPPHGGPPWGGPFWGGFRGRGHRGRARRGDVRASILALLKIRPMHGYEMIQEISELSGGTWRPSPGSVYPTLQLLEEEGLITGTESGGKRLFSLTETGQAEAEEGPEAPWEEAGRGVDWEAVHEVRQVAGGLFAAFGQVMATGSEEQRAKAIAVVNEARKKLYLILADET